jgi:hypothetical protein
MVVKGVVGRLSQKKCLSDISVLASRHRIDYFLDDCKLIFIKELNLYKFFPILHKSIFRETQNTVHQMEIQCQIRS